EQIETPVEVVVSDPYPHAGLLDAVVIESGAPLYAFLAERAVVVIYQQKAGAGIACDKNIGPPIVVEIGRNRRQTIASLDFRDARRFGHIRERAVPIVAKKGMQAGRQPARTAVHADILEHTVFVLAGLRSPCPVEVEVIGYEEVELAIAIVVDPSATGAPARSISTDARTFRHVGERAVSVFLVP